MAFKAETDDVRDSLSIKLINYLKKKKIKYIYSDPYYKDKFCIDEINYLQILKFLFS